MPIGGMLTQIQNQPNQPAHGGMGSIGSNGHDANPGNDTQVSGGFAGMAAMMQSHALLSQQAMAMGPQKDFDTTKKALVDSINNPKPRTDIQLNENHKAVVLDGFISPSAGMAPAFGLNPEPAHGFGVAEVLKETSGLKKEEVALISDTTRLPSHLMPANSEKEPMPSALLTAPGDATPSERLNSYIETGAAGAMSETNTALEAIADQKAPNLKGVNYSTSSSDLIGFNNLRMLSIGQNFNGENYLTEEGKVIFEGLGLKPELNKANLRQFAERGLARYAEVTDSSELVQTQVKRHEAVSKELKDQGVHYTVSSGNDGGVVELYRGAGVKVDDSADDNRYSNEHNLTIASLDTKGTADPNDDTVADHSVMGPEVDFLAPGVNRNVQVFGADYQVSGTSYSSPDVNGRLVKLSLENPKLSASAVQNLLHNSAGADVNGSSVSALR